MLKIVRSVQSEIAIFVIALTMITFAGSRLCAKAQDQAESVAEVRVIGNVNVPTDQIMRYVHNRAGMDFDKTRVYKVYEDVKRLLSSQLFKDVRSELRRESNGWVVTFHVCEFHNTIEEVVYHNVHHISQKDLETMMPGIHKGLPLNPKLNRQACRDIENYLKEQKGRYWANVILEEGSKETDRRVVFNVSEGPVLRERSVSFVGGGELAKNGNLHAHINRTSFLGMPLTISWKYHETKVESDQKKLQDYFVAQGYLDAKVTRELKFSEDYSEVDVVFHIHEGRQTNVRDSAPELIDVNYEATQQEPAKIGTIYVVGNDVTEDRVILRLLGLYPDQPLCHTEIKLGEAALRRSNLFDLTSEETKPTIEVLESKDGDDNCKDILVRVKESQTGGFMIGAGINSNAGLMGKTKITTNITEITIEGNKKVPAEKIMEYLRITRGMTLDKAEALIPQDTKRLLDSNLFQWVVPEFRVKDGGIKVIFHVVEHPVIEEIEFENAFHFTNQELTDLARSYGVARNMRPDPEANRRVCKEIQANLLAKGYHWATVTLKEGSKKSDQRVVFDVREGPLVHIRSISFAGNDNLPSDRLRARIDNKMILHGCNGVYSSSLAGELDQELEHLYHGNGYCKARVEHSVSFDHAYDEADLTFKITEKQRFRVKQRLFDSPAGKVPATVERVIQLKNDTFYDENIARADVGRIVDGYRQLGRQVAVKFDISYPQPGFVQILFKIAEQDDALTRNKPNANVVAAVVVEGNADVPTAQVLSFIQTRPGMTFDENVIHEDTRRLLDSNLFKYVSMEREVSGKGVVVHVCLEKTPREIDEVVYKDAHHIDQESLENLTKIRKGMPLDPVANLLACQEIQEFLKNKGRHWATVTLEEGNKMTDRRVIFHINEGPLVKVGLFGFVGNKNIASDVLHKQLDSPRTCLGCFGIFSDAAVQKDIVKLEEFYKANGYGDAKISRELLFSDDHSQVRVIFHIDEGAPVNRTFENRSGAFGAPGSRSGGFGSAQWHR